MPLIVPCHDRIVPEERVRKMSRDVGLLTREMTKPGTDVNRNRFTEVGSIAWLRFSNSLKLPLVVNELARLKRMI